MGCRQQLRPPAQGRPASQEASDTPGRLPPEWAQAPGQGLSGLGFPLWFGSLLAAPGGAGQGPARGSRGRHQRIRRRRRGTRGGGGALPALQGEGVVIGPGLRPVGGCRRRFRGSRHRGLALRSGNRRSGGSGIALGGGLRGRTDKAPEAHAPARGRWRACHGSETGIPGWGRRGGAGRADPGWTTGDRLQAAARRGHGRARLGVVAPPRGGGARRGSGPGIARALRPTGLGRSSGGRSGRPAAGAPGGLLPGLPPVVIGVVLKQPVEPLLHPTA
jgi:hypothetical protein